MFGNKKLLQKIDNLESRIKCLEDAKVNEIGYGVSEYSILGGLQQESVKVDEAVKMIMDYLGVEIKSEPKKEDVIKIEKIKKKKS